MRIVGTPDKTPIALAEPEGLALDNQQTTLEKPKNKNGVLGSE